MERANRRIHTRLLGVLLLMIICMSAYLLSFPHRVVDDHFHLRGSEPEFQGTDLVEVKQKLTDAGYDCNLNENDSYYRGVISIEVKNSTDFVVFLNILMDGEFRFWGSTRFDLYFLSDSPRSERELRRAFVKAEMQSIIETLELDLSVEDIYWDMSSSMWPLTEAMALAGFSALLVGAFMLGTLLIHRRGATLDRVLRGDRIGLIMLFLSGVGVTFLLLQGLWFGFILFCIVLLVGLVLIMLIGAHAVRISQD